MGRHGDGRRSRDAAARPGIYRQVEAEGYAYALKRANPVATAL